MWRTCAEWHGRAAASTCGPSPSPAPSTASPPGGARRASPVRNARTESVALAVAGVISGRTSASGRPYVPQSRRLIRSPGRSRAEGCGGGTDAAWSARSVERTARRWAWSSKAQRAAAGVHEVHGTCWRAAGDEPAAGQRQRTSARDPSTRAALHALFGGTSASRAYRLVGLWVHANRAHLAAREEGLYLGVAIGLGGGVGWRDAILWRGHSKNEGGGARIVSGERDGGQELRTTMAQQTRARARARRRRATIDGAGSLGSS